MSLTVFSFGSDWKYLREARLMLRGARASYPSAEALVFGRRDLPDWILSYAEQFPRGFGFWIWKAWLIDQLLRRVEDGSVVLYVDARSRFPDARVPWLDRFMGDSHFDVAAWQMDNPEREWTSSDLIEVLSDGPASVAAQSGQYAATFLALRANEDARTLTAAWIDFQRSNGQLVRSTASEECDHPSFVENRFDQSVLSLLIKSGVGDGLRVLTVSDDDMRSSNSLIPHASPHPDALYPFTHTRVGRRMKGRARAILRGGA